MRQVINLAPPEGLRDWEDSLLRLEKWGSSLADETQQVCLPGSRVKQPTYVPIFAIVSHQTRLDTRSKARRPIKVGIKGRGGRKRAETRTLLVYAAHQLTWCNGSLMASSFTNPNVGPSTYASLRLKLDARSSAIRGVTKGTKVQLAHPKVA